MNNTRKQENYLVQSPVLFIVFNRPQLTSRVFETIRMARPEKLYIAADGPRNNEDQENCKSTRLIIEQVDWSCKVKTLFREENQGCKNAVSSAINWFFENEEEGIILEDDCLPSSDFFWFCDMMLNQYRHDSRIRHICGCNFQHGKKHGEAAYYFSRLSHVWGWATWRRVWKDYDKNLSQFNPVDSGSLIKRIFRDESIAAEWNRIFLQLKNNEIDTWDYQLAFLNFFNHSLSIIPNKNLVTNIGFGADATHTLNPADKNANIAWESLNEITHPVYILPEDDADFYTLKGDLVNDINQPKKRPFIKRLFKN